MTNNKFKVLITRPEKQGRVLMKALTDIGIKSMSVPLFDYQIAEHYHKTVLVDELIVEPRLAGKLTCINNPAIIIFVSVAAVEFANQILPISTWSYHSLIAIGSATQLALKKLGYSATCPSLQTSEGLLALAEMQTLQDKNIIIVRGNGGREMMAQAISAKGGHVDYFECYQRKWRKFNDEITRDIANDWQKSGVNCIVITSNDLLNRMLNLTKNNNHYWQKECLWLVASQRIAEQAKLQGVMNVLNTQGANDEAIIHAINQYGIADEK
jgi:uroporphyrinogen-III synthase